MSDNAILCYCAAVKKQLQPETLTQSLKYLILYNEMLQACLENGKYAPEPEAREEERNKLLSIYDGAGKSDAEIETLIDQIIKDLSGEMDCRRGASIRAALLNIDQGFNKLLLLSHRAIVDQRGLVLILEDLYRIYEQLSNGKKVALRPARKTYQEFIKEVEARKRIEFDDPEFSDESALDLGGSVLSDANCGAETAAFRIMLDNNLKRRLFSWRLAEFELTPVEALAGALLKSLAKASRQSPVSIYVKSDCRFADETLKHTVGALTQTYVLPRNFAEEYELFSDIRRLRGILHDIPSDSPKLSASQAVSQFSKGSNTDLRLRLNLEYLTDYPWLGGDEWLPESFIIAGKSRVTGNYAVEIMPSFLSDGIEILVEYKETPELRALAEKFAADLVPELEIILRYCEGYVDAKDFWVREFAKATAQMKIEVEGGDRKTPDRGRASLTIEIEKSVMDRALLNFEADEPQLLLAAYSILVSRLSGNENLVLLCALDEDSVGRFFPLRLAPIWTSSFRLFVEQVKGRLRQASALGQYAFDILGEEQSKHGWPDLILEAGYCFRRESTKKRVERPAIGSPAIHHSFHQDPDLVLEISECDGAIAVCFVYEPGRFSAETIKRFGVYLNVILEDAAADVNIKLGDIEFERDPKGYEMAVDLAEDAFNF